jgi:hypothetical protein
VIRPDAVSFTRTGCIVAMSEMVASMTRPPCWGFSVVAAEGEAPPPEVLLLHETATNVAAPRTATSRRMSSRPPIAHFVAGDTLWYAGH